MNVGELPGDPKRTRRFLELVLRTGEMNGAYVDTNLRHTWVHNSAPEPSDEEILGKTDAELFSEEMAEPTRNIKRKAIETESHVERKFTFVKPWGQNRYHAAAEPLYDGNGDVEGAMFAAIDLSDKYRFLERTTDAVYTVDSDWEVTFWNEQMAARTGTEPHEMVGKNLWDTFGDSIPDELEERYRRVMATGEPTEFEQYIPEPYDYWVEVRAFGDENGISVYSRNITERKEQEMRLKRQRDTLDVLNHVLTHDIRNDLQLVTAYAEMLANNLDEGDKEYAEIISENAKHAVELTKIAAEISKVLFSENDSPRRLSLRDTLHAEIQNVRVAHPEAAILVTDEIQQATVIADDMLGSVFRNLLKNAIQHNDKQIPEVRISTDERPDEILVRIADNGPGISDTQKDSIFQKGEKGLESQGTGIGLYLVNVLVDRYDGELDVSDNAPKGTVFSVTLPRVREGQSGA